MLNPRMEKIPISVLVPVKNEIANIRQCLRGLEFADELTLSRALEGRRELS